MKRLFLAIDISEEARKKVSAYAGDLRHEFRHLSVGWERPEKLHLTLKFLGDSDEKQLALLRPPLENTAAAIESICGFRGRVCFRAGVIRGYYGWEFRTRAPSSRRLLQK